MIGRFFGWLGQVIASFFSWLGNLLKVLFNAIIDGIQAFFDYLLGLIQTLADYLANFVLGLLPDSEVVQQGVTVLRSCWLVADQFVPLSEGFVLILLFAGFYLTVKIVGLVIRIVLAVIP